MNRREIYTPELPRTYDLLKGWRDAFIGVGFAAGDVLGSYVPGSGTGSISNGYAMGNSPLNSLSDRGGLTASYSATSLNNAVVSGFNYFLSTSALTINIDIGSVYVPLLVDAVGNVMPVESGTATAYGDLGADSDSVVGQLLSVPTQLTVVAPASGCNWYAIYATPTVTDGTQSDDPNLQSGNNNAVIPYYNSANPNVPYAGPNGAGTQQSTVRLASVTVSLSAAIAGTSTTVGNTTGITRINLPNTAVPLYYVQVIAGQTHVPSTQIWAVGRGTAGPNSGANGGAPLLGGVVAPWLSGLLGQHHLGVPGTAPQIDGGVEWKPLSKVSNNGQILYNLGKTQLTGPLITAGNYIGIAGAAAPPTPGITASASGCSVTVESGSSDNDGYLTLAMTATYPIAPGASVNMATLTFASGLAPWSVVLTPATVATLVGLQAGLYSPGLQVAAVINSDTVSIYFYNGTGSTITIQSTANFQFSYHAGF